MQDMAGSGGMELPPLRDLSRRAASFLRMARLALTGAATPAQLLAREEVVDGLSCNPYYKSISTEDDWGSELWPDQEDESELLVDDEDGSTVTLVGGGVGGPLDRKPQFRHRSAAPGAHVTAEEPSEPLMTRRATKRVNDAVAVDHPFGRDRRGGESSSLLLVSS